MTYVFCIWTPLRSVVPGSLTLKRTRELESPSERHRMLTFICAHHIANRVSMLGARSWCGYSAVLHTGQTFRSQ